MIRGAFESRARAGFGKKILNEKSWLEILFRGATFHRYRYLPVPEIVSTIDNRQAGVVADRVRRNRTKKCSKEIVSLGRAFWFMEKHLLDYTLREGGPAGALVWDHHQKTYSKRQATSLEKKLEILPKLFTFFVKFSKNTLQNECPILNFFNFTFTMLLQTNFYFLSKKHVLHFASCIP